MVNQSIIVKNIQIGEETLTLLVEATAPCIEYRDLRYKSLISLFEALPLLYNPLNTEYCAEVVNFLLMGEKAQVIHAIDLYRAAYLKNKRGPYLSRFGEYDLSTLHPPKRTDQQLIFFIHNLNDGLPYRVTTPIPITADSKPIQYQLLPQL